MLVGACVLSWGLQALVPRLAPSCSAPRAVGQAAVCPRVRKAGWVLQREKGKENAGDGKGRAMGTAQRRRGVALAARGSTCPQACSTPCLGGEVTSGEEQVQKIPSASPGCSVPGWLETAQSSAFTAGCVTGRGKPRPENQNLENARGGVSVRALQPSPACKGHLGHCHQPGHPYLHRRAQARVRAAALPSPSTSLCWTDFACRSPGGTEQRRQSVSAVLVTLGSSGRAPPVPCAQTGRQCFPCTASLRAPGSGGVTAVPPPPPPAATQPLLALAQRERFVNEPELRLGSGTEPLVSQPRAAPRRCWAGRRWVPVGSSLLSCHNITVTRPWSCGSRAQPAGLGTCWQSGWHPPE